MNRYSPFDKAISDLSPADLASLKTVGESWYVEYKSELINSKSLAKSLSAFANTYGGWLFIGVKEQDNKDQINNKFPGISKQDVDCVLQRLRHSASDHLNPVPFFKTKVLTGPCSEIGLIEGTSVVVIEVPQSHTAPHIHKDGRIYRRVADGSEPKPEIDRFILDELWRRADPIREITRKWVEHDPEFSQTEEEIPYVRLLLCVDPWFQRNPTLSVPFHEIRNIMTSLETDSSTIPLDTTYTTADGGIIARQVEGNEHHHYTMTWKMSRDLLCDIVLPLPLYTPDNLEQLCIDLDGYNQKDHFISILAKQKCTEPRIVDLNFMMAALFGIVSKYRRLLKLAGVGGEFFAKIRVLNAWRTSPFVDDERVLNEFKKHGLPLLFDSTTTVPTGHDPGSFLRLINIDDQPEVIAKSLQGILFFTLVAAAFGIPNLRDFETEPDKIMVLYPELKDACDRALVVQRNRNRRRSES